MFVLSLLIGLWPEFVIRIFNSEPGMVDIGVDFLRIQIVGWMMLGFIITLMNCLNGVGDTWIPTLNTLITMWAVQVPLAYFLPKYTDLGVNGVRWAMVAAMVIRAAVFAVYFKTGRWKRKKI